MAENNKDKDTKKEKVKLPADFDIASYAQNYKGHARVVRLAYVADVGEGAEKVSMRETWLGGGLWEVTFFPLSRRRCKWVCQTF